MREIASNELAAVAGGDGGCKYDRKEYGEGAVIKVGDAYIQFGGGIWRLIPRPASNARRLA
ncbi:DUF1496 domain-containing protein [Paucibacter soli]|uniref:DUF1496 domain-containing protein n=1 Tax=Paucibacter soli TaxID=3133433 RepID=UPI004037312D